MWLSELIKHAGGCPSDVISLPSLPYYHLCVSEIDFLPGPEKDQELNFNFWEIKIYVGRRKKNSFAKMLCATKSLKIHSLAFQMYDF
jgi:hypothetical protein